MTMNAYDPRNESKFSTFENRTMGISGLYPSNWVKNDTYNTSEGISHIIFNPPQNKTYTVDISSSAASSESLSAFTSRDIDLLRSLLSNFNILNIESIDLKNGPAYCISYSYAYTDTNTNSTNNYYGVAIYTKNGDYEYRITAYSESSQFFNYIDLFSHMINSLNFTNSGFLNAFKSPIIRLGNSPTSFGYNPNTKLLYISNIFSDTVSILNTRNNTVIGNIKVGSQPEGLAVNPNTNSIYIANVGSDTISIIDGLTNNVTSTFRIPDMSNIIMDPYANIIFASHVNDNNISVINPIKQSIISTITSPISPNLMAINPITKQIFVSDGSANLSSITYYFDDNQKLFEGYSNITNIEQGIVSATSLIVNINNNMVYVASDINDTIAVINGFDLNDTKDIKVSYQPSQMSIDSNNNSLFVTHGNNDTVTIVNTTTDKVVKVLKLKNIPQNVFVNDNSNIAYILDNDGVFTIDGKTKNISIGVKFNINPPIQTWTLECNNKNYSNTDYVYFDLNTPLTCTPKPIDKNNAAYQFSSLNYLNKTILANDTKPPYTVNLTNFGTITTSLTHVEPESFSQRLVNALNKDYHDLIYVFASAAIIGPIIGWAIPYILLHKEKRRQLKYLNTYFPLIDDLYKQNHQTKEKCVDLLEQQRKELITLLQDGFLNDVTFRLLNSRIIEYISKLSRE